MGYTNGRQIIFGPFDFTFADVQPGEFASFDAEGLIPTGALVLDAFAILTENFEGDANLVLNCGIIRSDLNVGFRHIVRGTDALVGSLSAAFNGMTVTTSLGPSPTITFVDSYPYIETSGDDGTPLTAGAGKLYVLVAIP